MKWEKVKLWGKGKPLAFVVLAVLIASSADQAAELVRILIGRKRSARRLPPGPALGEWLGLYRHHRRLVNAVGEPYMADWGMSASEAQDALRKLGQMPEDERRAEVREV